MFRLISVFVFLSMIAVTSMATEAELKAKKFVIQNSDVLEAALFNADVDKFSFFGEIMLAGSLHAWAAYCSYGPPVGGLVIFELDGSIKDTIGHIGCITKVEQRDVNNDGSEELLVYDYSTGTGFRAEILHMLSFNKEGKYSERDYSWAEEASTAVYNPGNDDDVMGYDYKKQAILEFKDNDEDGFNELMLLHSKSDYIFEGEAAWVDELFPEKTKEVTQTFLWNELSNQYLEKSNKFIQQPK